MSTTHASPAFSDEAIDRLARKRAGMRLGWFSHAMIFVTVNALLVVISAVNGQHRAVFPLLGWGLGLAIHGAVVFLRTGGHGLPANPLRGCPSTSLRLP